MKTCLSIAGSDPSGGAGIQADLKTFAANGVYGMSVVTALTAQNTTGVTGIHTVPADFLRKELDAVFSDIFPDAVKVGMLSDPEGIREIAAALMSNNAANVVIDPVMVATSGAALISDEARAALITRLLPMADVITPNIPEAEVLTDMTIRSQAEMLKAAELMVNTFGCAVLVKGGHQTGDGSLSGVFTEFADSGQDAVFCPAAESTDLLLIPGEEPVYLHAKRLDNPNTHGTGCTLSSAIAAGLALGKDMTTAVKEAKEYVTGAIAAGLDLGKGRGPLDHMYCRNSGGCKNDNKA